MSLKDVIYFSLIVVLLTLLAISLAYRAVGEVLPFLAVKSGSMRPTLEIGDVIMMEKVNPEEIKVGDVIIFYKPGSNRLIVHRVVKKTDEGVYTKGDANPGIDIWSPLPYESIVGRWNGFKIPYWLGVGYASLFLTGEIYPPYGKILLIALIFLNIVLIIMDLVGRRASIEESSEEP